MKLITKKFTKFFKNTLYSLLVLLSVLFIFLVKNPFYLNSTPLSIITSGHNWENFSAYKNKKIFAHQKLKAEFKASNNRLGTIEVEFNISAKWPFIASDYDSLIFRIKEKGKEDWHYENTVNNIRTPNAFYPFGFPVIENSKNKIYEIEVESVAGADNNAFSLSSKDAFFLSKYSFPRNYLQQDKKRMVNFLFRKTLSFFASLAFVPLANYLFILFFSFSFSIIQRLTKLKNRKKTIAETQKIFIYFLNNIWLLIVGIIITLIFYQNSEKLEWAIYQISAITIVFFSFAFAYFYKKKISQLFYAKLLNFHTISFASFVLFLSLSKSIMPRRLLFLPLAFLPFIKGFHFKNIKNSFIAKIMFIKSAYPRQAILINMIGIFFVLSYFNIYLDENSYLARDINFPGFSLLKICLVIVITIVLFFIFQSPRKFFKTKLKIPLWILLVFSLPIIFYITQKPTDDHHYISWIGPAFDLIKGKSLWGETPSLYGYLSIHFIAFLLNKIGFSFANFNLLNTLLYFFYYLLAIFIFLKLIKNKFLAITASAIFITLQTLFSYYSISFAPSVGPMRFGIGLLIIFILSYFPQNISFFLGSIFASIALFWSIETAIYIVPAWLAVCLIFSYNSTNSFKEFLKSLIRKLSFFGITTATTFSLIILKEYSIQHAFPRISDYLEYAIAFKGGVVSLPIPIYGNYYFIIAVMILGIVTTTYLLTKNIKTKFLPLLIFISIHNVAIFSYFISRSHENNIVNITGFNLLLLAIVFYILINVLNVNINQLKKTIILPIILFLSLYILRLTNQVINLRQYIQTSYQQNMIDWFNPVPSAPILSTALIKYNLEDQPVALLMENKDTRLLVESNIKNELPINPAFMNDLFNSDWQKKYVNPILPKLKIGTVVITDDKILKGFLRQSFKNIQKMYNLDKIGVIEKENLIIYQIISIKKV